MKFGDPQNPLLVSCRSGARQSMPGMMETVLNIGLNDESVLGLAKQAGSRCSPILMITLNLPIGLRRRRASAFR